MRTKGRKEPARSAWRHAPVGAEKRRDRVRPPHLALVVDLEELTRRMLWQAKLEGGAASRIQNERHRCIGAFIYFKNYAALVSISTP